MKARHSILLILLTCVCTLRAEAQLTLDSCLALAEHNNRSLRLKEIEVEKAREVKAQAFTKYFPQVSAHSLGFHSLRPMFEYGIDNIENAGTRDLLNTLYGNYGAALGLDNTFSLFQHGVVAGVTAIQPIFMGGQIVNGNRLAALGVEAAELQRDMVSRDKLQDVEESYWLVINLQDKQTTLDSALALMDTLVQTVSTAVEAGLAVQNDLLKVKMKQNELLSKQLQLQNGINLARRALCQAIDLTYSDSIKISDNSAIDFPETALGTADQAAININDRPETRLLALQVEAANLQKKMEIGKALPQVAFGAGYAFSNMLGKNSTNGTLFFTVQVPITGWWETSHKIKEHNLNMEAAQLQEQDLREQMELQNMQAQSTLIEAEQQLILHQTTLENAKENYRLARINYEAGLMTITELLEAQTTYLQAKNSHTDLQIAYKIALRRWANLNN